MLQTVACISYLFSTNISAQNAYRIDAIPQTLRPYAHAVVRFSETVHTVTSPSAYETTRRHAVTVMNTQGVSEGVIVLPYNKLTHIKSIKATLYDAAGNVLKKIKMSEFDDLSLINRFSLFEDERMLKYVPQVNKLPYTVEYECELRTKTTFFLPTWRPQYRPGIAIEQSSCRFVSPVDYAIRFNIHGITPAAEQITGKQKQVLWVVENVTAWRGEPFLPPVDSISPWVMTAPVSFEIDGMTGRFTNWEEYGQWCYNNLLKGRDKLPDETIARVRRMIENIHSPREKARKIYEYCQQKNRYISIQKGKTGGISPMPAAEVDRLSYGDCKALCNYTRVLLEAAGIQAFYAIIQADDRPANPPEMFANANFGNHIVLCLPLDGDTVWLECTNNKAPFGYLGSFTGNRKALLCTPDGGLLARTTIYRPGDNLQQSSAQFVIDAKGRLTGSFTKRFAGIQYDQRDEALATLNAERINDLKKIYSGFPGMEILNYSLIFDKEQILATERLQLESERFAPVTGNRMYIPLNPVNALQSLPGDLRSRTQEIYIAHGYCDRDHIRFTIPPGYRVEAAPALTDLNEDFGSYHFEVAVANDTINVYRSLRINDITLPPGKYGDVAGFLKKVYNSDHSKVVLVKTGT